MQQQVGLRGGLQRVFEAAAQARREPAYEANRVDEQRLVATREVPAARVRV